jgi:putative oxygen-independent coproporphyrinogen III oxidase
MDRITNAIVQELVQRKQYLKGEMVDTVYFGGGTPSMLNTSDIEKILRIIFLNFRVNPEAEITIEANPDDITPEKLFEFKKAGVNRLSIGIQSFRQEDLDFLSRMHTSEQVVQCIKDAKLAGFQNLSIDLIYGIPTLTDNDWEANLQKAFAFEIPHISAYSLTIEEKTPLEFLIRKGRAKGVDEDQSLSQYHLLCKKMQHYGYEHYEVSNFCLPGAYSKHNTAYWQGNSYLGVGPSAHSYNGNSRCWNVANLDIYIESVANGKVDAEEEMLSSVTQLNEYIMTSLRTIWGCDLVEVEKKFGAEQAESLLNRVNTFIEAKKMNYHNGKLILTEEGLLFADGIASELFGEEEPENG